MITYRYAKNSTGKRIAIGEVSHLNKDEKYYCIGCDKEMIPCMGKVKKHYFRHKKVGECSGETYLHVLGKMTFEEVYESCINNGEPFIFRFETEKLCTRHEKEVGLTCFSDEEMVQFDLTKRFSKVKLEKKDGEFIPDLQLISDNDEVIYIEIAVTHKSEEKKQISGKKVIEFLIESESDIKHIESKSIYWRADWINTFGINPKPIKGVFCDSCTEEADLFVVYSSGKSILKPVKYSELLSNIKRFSNMTSVIYYKHNKTKNGIGNPYSDEVIKAYKQGINIKNCYLCRYHARNKWNEDGGQPIFCKFLKKAFGSNCASDCEYFKPDEEVF